MDRKTKTKNISIEFLHIQFRPNSLDSTLPVQRSDSVNLDSGVDLAHEKRSAHISHRATHDAQSSRKQSHVAKVESRLEQPIHSRKVTIGYITICSKLARLKQLKLL